MNDRRPRSRRPRHEGRGGSRRRRDSDEALALRNPHAALAVFEQRPRDVLEVRLPPRGAAEAWQRVAEAAEREGVRITTVEPPDRDDGPKDGRRTGAEALVRPPRGVEVASLFAEVDDDAPRLWLALDGVQDPRNLGATMRSAAFFGVAGAIITEHQSAPITAVAVDTAAGGFDHVPFATVTNLARALEEAKARGLWVLGTSEHGAQDVRQIDRDRNWLVVVGSEEKGLRRLTLKHCDDHCKIVPSGGVGTLNVSVAASVLLATLRG